MNGHQGRHIRAGRTRKALPMPLNKILLYEPDCACLLCVVFSVCARVEWLQGKCLFALLVKKNTHFPEGSQDASPLWNASGSHWIVLPCHCPSL